MRTVCFHCSGTGDFAVLAVEQAFLVDAPGTVLGARSAAGRHHRRRRCRAVVDGGGGGVASVGNRMALPGVVMYRSPAGEVQMTVASGSCSSRQPQNVLSK